MSSCQIFREEESVTPASLVNGHIMTPADGVAGGFNIGLLGNGWLLVLGMHADTGRSSNPGKSERGVQVGSEPSVPSTAG
jgi:hypothetical protein